MNSRIKGRCRGGFYNCKRVRENERQGSNGEFNWSIDWLVKTRSKMIQPIDSIDRFIHSFNCFHWLISFIHSKPDHNSFIHSFKNRSQFIHSFIHSIPFLTLDRTFDLIPLRSPNRSKCLCTCAASSSVGVKITARMCYDAPPFPPFTSVPCAFRRWRIGSRYAAVLPEPVGAMPNKSRFWMIMGIDCIWIGVGSLYSIKKISGMIWVTYQNSRCSEESFLSAWTGHFGMACSQRYI